MRLGPRGPRRSVDRGAHRPAIEPRKESYPGCRRRAQGGRQHVRARQREARTTWRGQRPWHVQTLLAREPGDLVIGRSAIAAGPHWEGEERAARLAAILVGESPTSIGVQSML